MNRLDRCFSHTLFKNRLETVCSITMRRTGERGTGRTVPGLWENLFGERPFTMTQTSMSSSDPRVELTREFFGALIALGALAFLWWEQRRWSAPRAASGGSIS